MNKNIFKGVVLIIIAMVTNGARCCESRLQEHEKEVSETTSCWNAIANINNLDRYAETQAQNTGRFNNNFFNQMARAIPETSPSFSRVQALEAFYSTDQETRKEAIKRTCVKKLVNMFI